MYSRACLILLIIICVRGSTLTAKEYICKDPDTGTLHTVNSTWRSTTFCGNYTCKLRKVNKTPTSKIIVNLTGPQARAPHSNDIRDENYDFSLTKILPELSKDSDRLLNTAEIQKITELLHTVKKSDLQAVIELYNVAQEIYKGMSIGLTENNVHSKTDYADSSEKSRTAETRLEDFVKRNKDKVSYWYEPVNGYRKEGDLNTEGSDYKITTLYPFRRPHDPPFFYASRSYPSYFSGTLLSHDDFGRVGYYHQQANIQNQVPYYQQRTTYNAPVSTPHSTCNPCPTYQYQTPMPATGGRSIYPTQQRPVEHMLPMYSPPPSYNASLHNYNHYSNYYKGNPWAYYDYYRNLPVHMNPQVQRNPVVIDAQVLENTDGQLKTILDDEKTINTDRENEKSWKTDPLSDPVIKDIRANIAERGKLLNIPLKRRIKLERAAKVIKIDQFNREKRSVLNNPKMNLSEKPDEAQARKDEEYNTSHEHFEMETFVEKMTCEPTNELGYFRVGNMTQPYPDCCPQKIDDKQR